VVVAVHLFRPLQNISTQLQAGMVPTVIKHIIIPLLLMNGKALVLGQHVSGRKQCPARNVQKTP
jgi:hypothetical protein